MEKNWLDFGDLDPIFKVTVGGLQMPHITSFCAALKIAWLKKILDIEFIAAWKTLFVDARETLAMIKYYT